MAELEILTNPIRSTLFGKFYEEIIRCWFVTEGFTVYKGKPRVYGGISQHHLKRSFRSWGVN